MSVYTESPSGSTSNAWANNMSDSDAISQFKDAMFDNGIEPPDNLIGDGRLHRFKIDGKLNGAYVLHLDNRPAGYFEDFRQGVKTTWKLEGDFEPLSEQARQEFKDKCDRQLAARKAEEVEKYAAAAKKAVYLWNKADLAPDDHPYLVSKGVKAHGIRLGRDNALMIPIYSPQRELVNLQFIAEAGEKRFLWGGRKSGCFFVIGKPTDKILIGEGFATGASLHQDSDRFTVVAFDSGNLKDVAVGIKKLFKGAEITICGDHDDINSTNKGVGMRKGREAAQTIRCDFIFPPIVGMDFNDMLSKPGVQKGTLFGPSEQHIISDNSYAEQTLHDHLSAESSMSPSAR